MPCPVIDKKAQEKIQVFFRENPTEPVKTNESYIQIGYPLTEDNLEAITKILEKHLPALAQSYHHKQKDQLKKLVLSGVDRKKTLLSESIQEAEYTLDNLNKQIFELARTRKLDKHILTLLEKPSIPLNKKMLDEYKRFSALLKTLGTEGTLHDLRHTYASHLAMNGTPIPVIKELLGHADISTTMIYSHLSPEMHKAAVDQLPFRV